MKRATVGFDREAASYAGVRPTYATEAIERIVELIGGSPVCDLAAGTGIFTRQLLSSRADPVAVEPVAGMRRQFVADTPEVPMVAGTAECVPFRDRSFGAVTVAQAFHWFDAPVALREVRRVLAPRGVLVMIWNERDHREAWIREWTAVVDGLALAEGERPYHRHQDTDWAAVVAADGGFEPLVTTTFDNPQTGTPDGLVERARSMSYVAALDASRQARVLDAVRRLAASHPDLSGRDRFPVPYLTHLHVTRTLDA